LIQNVCPVSEEFIDCQYMIENNTVPVTINDKLSAEINGIVRKVIRLNKRGVWDYARDNLEQNKRFYKTLENPVFSRCH